VSNITPEYLFLAKVQPTYKYPTNTHLTPKARRLNSNRPKTRQQKSKMKSNRGRRKGKSNGVMVIERVVSKRKRIRRFFLVG